MESPGEKKHRSIPITFFWIAAAEEKRIKNRDETEMTMDGN